MNTTTEIYNPFSTSSRDKLDRSRKAYFKSLGVNVDAPPVYAETKAPSRPAKGEVGPEIDK